MARPRRPRRRWIGGACRRVHAPVGGRRVGHHPSHVGSGRATVDGHAQRLSSRAPRQSVLGVSPCGRQRVGPPDGSLRRAGRGVERRAVDEPAVVPQAAHHLPPPRARPDVGSAAAAAVRRHRRALEARFAPPFYRRALTLTPSEATRDDLLGLGFRADRVVAVNNGVDPMFQTGGTRSAIATGALRRQAGAGEAAGRADRGSCRRPTTRARPAG